MVYLPDILDSLDNVFLSVTWLVFLMYLMKWILTLGSVFLGVAWLVYLSYACFISHLRPDLQFFGCFFSFDGWHMSIFFMIVEKNIYAMGICLIFCLFALVLNSFQWMQSIFFIHLSSNELSLFSNVFVDFQLLYAEVSMEIVMELTIRHLNNLTLMLDFMFLLYTWYVFFLLCYLYNVSWYVCVLIEFKP